MSGSLISINCPHCNKPQQVEKGVISIYCKYCHNRIELAARKGWAKFFSTGFSTSKEEFKTKLIECPSCGEKNEVSAEAVSAFCKGCGNVIVLKKDKSGIEEIDLEKALPRKTRITTCYFCSAEQEVAINALSAFCSKCGNRIELEDMEISGYYNEDITTRGRLHVMPGSNVYGTIDATEVRNDGEIKGNVVVENKLTIGSTGRLFGNVVAKALRMDDGAVFVGTLKLNVRGQQDSGS